MSAETGGTQLRVHTHESEQHKPEYGPELRDAIVSMVESFLAKPGAQTLDRSTFDWLYDPKNFKHENPVEVLINAKDPASNTSFLIERAPSVTDRKGYALSIKWLTLGKGKGALPSGHLSVVYRTGKEPQVITQTIPETWAIPENDDYWEHVGGKHSFDALYGPNNVTDEGVADILERLRNAQVNVKQSEHTAQLDIYDTRQAGYAVAMSRYYEVKKNSSWKTIGAVILAEIEFRKEEKKWEEFKKEWKRKSKLAS